MSHTLELVPQDLRAMQTLTVPLTQRTTSFGESLVNPGSEAEGQLTICLRPSQEVSHCY